MADQLSLVGASVPELPRTIDLRCSDIGHVLKDCPEGFDLVVADPPWDLYRERPGMAAPDLSYPCLPVEVITSHLEAAAMVARPGARILLWACWPLMVEWMSPRTDDGKGPFHARGIDWKSGGAWVKDQSTPGVGFHWRGHSEPVLLGVVPGGVANRPYAEVRSGHASPAQGHSRKPVDWMVDWVEAYVPPGGAVLDLYAGTGAVAEAVVRAGKNRKYLGAEVSAERHAKAQANIRRAYVESR
jgi:hypothetical protein